MAYEPTMFHKAGEPDRIAYTQADEYQLIYDGWRKGALAPKQPDIVREDDLVGVVRSVNLTPPDVNGDVQLELSTGLHAVTHHAGGIDPLTAEDIGAVANTDPRITSAVRSVNSIGPDVDGNVVVTTDPEQIRDSVAAALRAGRNVSIVHDDLADTITIDSDADPEAVMDIIGAGLVAGAGTTITYDDVAGTITVATTTDPEVVRDSVAAALRAGANVTIVTDDVADTITISSTDTTDPEVVRDTIATALRAGANVTVVHDDVADTITISSTDTNTTDPEVVRDTVAAALRAGSNVTIAVDDVADTITISSTDTNTTDPEIVMDTVAGGLVGTGTVTVTYDDVAGTITLAGAGTDAEAVRDTVSTMLLAGQGITLVNDDAADTLTISTNGGAGTVQTRRFVNGAWEVRGDPPAGTVVFWLKRDATVPDPPIDGTYMLADVDLLLGATDAPAGTTVRLAANSKFPTDPPSSYPPGHSLVSAGASSNPEWATSIAVPAESFVIETVNNEGGYTFQTAMGITGSSVQEYLRIAAGDTGWGPWEPTILSGSSPHFAGVRVSIDAKAATALPNEYPAGLSTMVVSADASWPDGGYGHILTIQDGGTSGRVKQFFLNRASTKAYFRTSNADNSWGAWEGIFGAYTKKETITLPAAVLKSRPDYGEPTMVTTTTWWQGWALDASIRQFVGSQVDLPEDWNTCHVDVLWVGEDATAGDINMRTVFRNVAEGSGLSASGGAYITVPNSTATGTPLRRTRLISDTTCASAAAGGPSGFGGLFFAGVERNAGAVEDTYAGRMIVLAVSLVRAS